MQDSTKRLLAYLDATGSGDSKLAQIKAIICEEPDIGCAALVEEMRAAGLPPGTLRKAEQWMDDPSIVLEPRVRKSQGALLAESAADYNRKHEVPHVQPRS